ncbi:YfbM family protein [Hymenobacter sp. ASUV-10]|uniref:YfbM family protein n=1 Tax=Hymenobacter aranciens TaxID=3063996 RepID=A0ABT9BCB0_9BACT|nr:YfbM family protein [Hymenobacter sp. ASUV-10]MDO7875910.1 YfbM family protein [Hymenobacter sp. ASUV-10]
MSMIGNLLRVTDAELQTYLADSAQLETRLYQDSGTDRALTDIDKTWDGIIFLLTGDALSQGGHQHPLARVLFSGQLIDAEQDLGYGPAHFLRPEEVAELQPQLAALTVARLKQRFDPAKMTELDVYPGIWDEGDEAFEYVMGGFETVQEHYAEAAQRGEGMITFLS